MDFISLKSSQYYASLTTLPHLYILRRHRINQVITYRRPKINDFVTLKTNHFYFLIFSTWCHIVTVYSKPVKHVWVKKSDIVRVVHNMKLVTLSMKEIFKENINIKNNSQNTMNDESDGYWLIIIKYYIKYII